MGYEVGSLNEDINKRLKLEERGWEGEGRTRVCLLKDEEGRKREEKGEREKRDELVVGIEYDFWVQGTSNLFRTTSISNISFLLSPPSPSPSSSSCSLWDPSPPLSGIILSPSGDLSLPSSLRSFPLTLTTKALLSSCWEGEGEGEEGEEWRERGGKDILAKGNITWMFLNGGGREEEKMGDEELQEWAREGGRGEGEGGVSGRMVIPSSALVRRDIFPVNIAIGIRVMVDFGDDRVLFLYFFIISSLEFIFFFFFRFSPQM